MRAQSPTRIIPYRRRGGPAEPRRPFVELYVGGGLVIPFYGLVDSGSDCSVIPKALATLIGIKYDETKPEKGSAAAGADFDYYTATNQLLVQTEVGALTFEEAMVVAEEDDFILGRRDFFRHYRITFNEREQNIEITPYELSEVLH